MPRFFIAEYGLILTFVGSDCCRAGAGVGAGAGAVVAESSGFETVSWAVVRLGGGLAVEALIAVVVVAVIVVVDVVGRAS